jgi:hypothetical protein
MRLIGMFVDAYLSLDEAEGRRFVRLAEAKLPPEQKEDFVEYVTSWERKGIQIGLEKGRQEGALEALHAVLLDVLSARFGVSGQSLQGRIAQIDSVEELRALTHRALEAGSLEELGISWNT